MARKASNKGTRKFYRSAQTGAFMHTVKAVRTSTKRRSSVQSSPLSSSEFAVNYAGMPYRDRVDAAERAGKLTTPEATERRRIHDYFAKREADGLPKIDFTY